MKPKRKAFEKAVEKYGGNITKVAKAFKVTRFAVYKWMDEDPELKQIVDDARGTLFDDCLSTARVVAMGIPDVQNGKIVGWVERPDSSMLRYLIGSLGRKEGFGESIDVTTNGKDINSLNLFRVLTKEEIQKFDDDFDENF